jgi:hypothetical protein
MTALLPAGADEGGQLGAGAVSGGNWRRRLWRRCSGLSGGLNLGEKLAQRSSGGHGRTADPRDEQTDTSDSLTRPSPKCGRVDRPAAAQRRQQTGSLGQGQNVWREGVNRRHGYSSQSAAVDRVRSGL